METDHLRAVIVKVTRDGEVVTEQAFGVSMDDVPATTDMYLGNGPWHSRTSQRCS